MKRLGSLSIAARLVVLVVVLAVGLGALTTIAALQAKSRILADRKATTQAVVQEALGSRGGRRPEHRHCTRRGRCVVSAHHVRARVDPRGGPCPRRDVAAAPGDGLRRLTRDRACHERRAHPRRRDRPHYA